MRPTSINTQMFAPAMKHDITLLLICSCMVCKTSPLYSVCVPISVNVANELAATKPKCDEQASYSTQYHYLYIEPTSLQNTPIKNVHVTAD